MFETNCEHVKASPSEIAQNLVVKIFFRNKMNLKRFFYCDPLKLKNCLLCICKFL